MPESKGDAGPKIALNQAQLRYRERLFPFSLERPVPPRGQFCDGPSTV
jgi:hypothetical protein